MRDSFRPWVYVYVHYEDALPEYSNKQPDPALASPLKTQPFRLPGNVTPLQEVAGVPDLEAEADEGDAGAAECRPDERSDPIAPSSSSLGGHNFFRWHARRAVAAA